MNIKEIYDAFEKIGSVTFTTMNGEYPSSRIVHFLTYDHEGLYFFTMKSKPFYKQLKETGKMSACGLYAPSATIQWHDEKTPVSEPGYFIRVSGDVREFTIDDAKAKKDSRFDYLIYDNTKYPLITGFCLYDFHGEIYDYDFEREHRDHKLERIRFAFNSYKPEALGFPIADTCINCGRCIKSCSFSALEKGEYKPKQLFQRCDECGNCVVVCPVGAIKHKGL